MVETSRPRSRPKTSITSTVPSTSANTSLKESDKGRRLSLVAGNLVIVLQHAYWTFVQSRHRDALTRWAGPVRIDATGHEGLAEAFES